MIPAFGRNPLDCHTNLWKCDGDTDGAGARTGQGRFVILKLEAVDYFPVRILIVFPFKVMC